MSIRLANLKHVFTDRYVGVRYGFSRKVGHPESEKRGGSSGASGSRCSWPLTTIIHLGFSHGVHYAYLLISTAIAAPSMGRRTTTPTRFAFYHSYGLERSPSASNSPSRRRRRASPATSPVQCTALVGARTGRAQAGPAVRMPVAGKPRRSVTPLNRRRPGRKRGRGRQLDRATRNPADVTGLKPDCNGVPSMSSF